MSTFRRYIVRRSSNGSLLRSFGLPGNLYVATGSYVGNGTGQSIAGLGFTPKVVFAKLNYNASNSSQVAWDSFTAGSSFDWGSTGVTTTGITSLDADGFTLGSGAVNTSGQSGYYVAFGGDSNYFASGSYTGNGADNRNVVTGLTFQPDLVMVRRAGANSIVWRSKAITDDNTDYFRDLADQNGNIQLLNDDGFQVGDRTTVNASGATYYWFALKFDPSVIATGSYTGDGADDRNITGVGFNPLGVWIKNEGIQYGVFGTKYMGTDSSMPVSDAGVTAADSIQSFITDGFQVGTNALVNSNTVVYRWVAFKNTFSIDEDAAVHVTKRWNPHMLSPLPTYRGQRSINADLYEHVDNPVDPDQLAAVHVVTRWNPYMLVPLPTYYGQRSVTPQLYKAVQLCNEWNGESVATSSWSDESVATSSWSDETVVPSCS